MTRLISIILLAAACSTATPISDNANEALFKRQVNLLDLGKMKGEPGGSQLFISLARFMGASYSSGGNLMGFMKNVLNSGYGLISPSAGAAPKRVTLESKTGVEGAKAVKIRYGPYKVPKASHKNLMAESGMLSNYPQTAWEKPCTGNCVILGITPGLEYADGRSANIDSGLWLHHMIMFTTGPGRNDYTCGKEDVSLPHAVIGSTPRASERIFASGNERSPVIFSKWGEKNAGYKLKSTDRIDAVLELMNENADDRVVYVTMTYDVVDDRPGIGSIKVVWLDVRQCGTSEVNPPKGKPEFTLDYNWTSNIEGKIVGVVGHLHDGGLRVTLTNDGTKQCSSEATYGGRPEYVQKSAQGVHAHGALTHISDMGACQSSSFRNNGTIQRDQKWRMEAKYDLNQFKGMKHEDGSWDEVMGIALMFVKVNN